MEDFTNPWRDIEQIKKQLRTGIRTRANGRFVLFRDASLWVSTHPTSNIVAQMLEGTALLRAAMDSASTEDQLIIEEHEADPEGEGGSHEEFISLNVVVRVASHTGNDELREVLLDEIERRNRNDSRAASLTDDKAGQPHHPRAAPKPTPHASTSETSERASMNSPATVSKTNRLRARRVHPLDHLINTALSKISGGATWIAVWEHLVEMAKSPTRPVPLIGHEDREIRYNDDQSDDGIGYFSRDACRKAVERRMRADTGGHTRT